MKTKPIFVISLIMLCFFIWSLEATSAKYDPIVEQVQKRLRELGYDPGPVDGIMGRKTTEAIKSFQTDNSLLVTGELNDATLKKLGIVKDVEESPSAEPTPKLQKETPPKDPPKIKCSFYNCTVENGLTDELIERIKKHFAENKRADRLILKNGADADLTKLPVLTEGLIKLELRKSEDITDLTPLAALTNLERLEIGDLPALTDLTPIGDIQSLTYLKLRELGTPITLTPVAKLSNLQQLWIGPKVNFQSFDFLLPLDNLDTLSVYHSKPDPEGPSDIGTLAEKAKLKTLKFDGVNIKDISALIDSVELTTLRLSRAPIEDLSPITAFSKLKYLELSKVPVRELRPVGELTELKKLTLYYTEVTDLSPLASLKNSLEYLNLNGTTAKDMTPVGELAELTSIFLDETEFDDYSPLAKCTKLEFLQARGEKSGFGQLDVITSLPNLKRLWLDRNVKVQQWDALKTAANLEDFSAGKTSFSDLSLLANLNKLRDINIYECTVKNAESITKLPELKRLSVRGTKGIDDISIFKELPKIADLSVNYNKDQFPQEQIDALEKAKTDAKN